ncbi:cyclin-J-like [Antennarius striatus]|uniref:cyclin-J-like n=1 Tax=Antennarius striatus TaxID=241820 RepID=UPI0035B06378
MELDDQWWDGRLAADTHGWLRQKELKLPSYNCQSPQLYLRRYFTDLVAITSNHFGLCPTARHLAVYLLDLFMDSFDVTVQQLHTVSFSCLLLASKFEDREEQVPRLDDLVSLNLVSSRNLVLTKKDLHHMELFLLENFNWNLNLPTAAHFIEYYLSFAVHEGDHQNGFPMTCLEKTKLYMAKYTDYFLEVSLQDHVFLRFVPSIVGASCVAASRHSLYLSPTWPPILQQLTGYTWENLIPCAEKLLIAHDSDVQAAKKQKCLQPGQEQPGTSGIHSSGQTATVDQYLQWPIMEYTQQPLQYGLAYPHPHASASDLSHPASLQASNGPQYAVLQTITTSIDPKPAERTKSVYTTPELIRLLLDWD